jgi:hypothetical protein
VDGYYGYRRRGAAERYVQSGTELEAALRAKAARRRTTT